MHPEDASKRGLTTRDAVEISNRVGRVTATVEVSEKIMRGVVSLPHGWGHRGERMEMQIASRHPGVNCNDLTDETVLEPVVGNAIFNGVPVEVNRAEVP